jgi:hypothetical protein
LRVNRWLTVLPFLFLLQISFCGQQDLDSALLTIEVLDDAGNPLVAANILLNGESLEQIPPITLELDPWISHVLEIELIEGWVFLPSSLELILEPGSEQTVLFEGSSLTALLNVTTSDLWGAELVGAEVYVDGSPQDVQTPVELTIPAGRELEISVMLEGWDYLPESQIIQLEAGSESNLEFEGVRSTRVILVEDFSNTSCAGCPEAEEAIWVAEGLSAGELLPLSYHLFWPAPFDPFYRYNMPVMTGRHDFYGMFYTLPTVFVNGVAVSDPLDSDEILSAAESELALAASLALRVESSRDGDDFTVQVDGKVLAALPTGAWRIYYGLAESEIEWEGGGNGQTHFKNVVRHLNGESDTLGEVFDPSNGELFSFSIVFSPDLEEVDENQLFAFVFVQAEGSREILDAAQETPGGP